MPNIDGGYELPADCRVSPVRFACGGYPVGFDA
jgi:hypothetical protein